MLRVHVCARDDHHVHRRPPLQYMAFLSHPCMLEDETMIGLESRGWGYVITEHLVFKKREGWQRVCVFARACVHLCLNGCSALHVVKVFTTPCPPSLNPPAPLWFALVGTLLCCFHINREYFQIIHFFRACVCACVNVCLTENPFRAEQPWCDSGGNEEEEAGQRAFAENHGTDRSYPGLHAHLHMCQHTNIK